ncbi:MAG: glycosyltransferase family A protein [Usitatibacter sp.]
MTRTTTHLVSVIIPCYNASAWISETLECVTGQSHANLEILAVDDGSDDDTASVLERHTDARMTVIRQANAGAAAARNAGLAVACGDFVQFVDADDLMGPDKIACQIAAAEHLGPRGVLAARWGRFRERIDDTQWAQPWSPASQSGIDWLVDAWQAGDTMMPPHGWLVPRALVEAAGPWNGAAGINDDGEYFTRVLLASSAALQVAQAQVFYRSGNASYSQRQDPWAWESLLNSYELCAYHLLQAEDSPRIRRAIAERIQGFRYRAYPRFPHLVARAAGILDAFGISRETPHGGGTTSKLLGRFLGWKVTRRLGLAAASLRDIARVGADRGGRRIS